MYESKAYDIFSVYFGYDTKAILFFSFFFFFKFHVRDNSQVWLLSSSSFLV